MTAPHSKVGKRFPIGYYFLYSLPKNAFSRLCGVVAEQNLPPALLHPLIKSFIWAFKIDMSEAAEAATTYPSFNAFFTRQLKSGVRPH